MPHPGWSPLRDSWPIPLPPALLFPSTVLWPLSARSAQSPATDLCQGDPYSSDFPRLHPNHFFLALNYSIAMCHPGLLVLPGEADSLPGVSSSLTVLIKVKKGHREVVLFVWKQNKDLGIANWFLLIWRFLSEWGLGQYALTSKERERASTGKVLATFSTI